MKKHEYQSHNIVSILLRTIAVIVIVLVFAFELYSCVVQKEGDSPLPPLFGNFQANRSILENVRNEGDFSFAVVGDTKSVGTFEKIVTELRNVPLDFAVLLGDCSYGGTEDDHRYFRAEAWDEYAMPFPVFYVVGNHDVSPHGFPIKRFEEVYGPSVFSFEYRKCLFIVLRILNDPFTNEDSLKFLAQFRNVDLSKYLHTFVFMHIPPPVSPTFEARTFPESKPLLKLFDDLGIDYVFAGDFHGYAQSKKAKTTYIITGGGGAHLSTRMKNQFHHATVVHVTPKSVDTRIIFVPPVYDLEDRLEKLAITKMWPLMKRNIVLTVLLNIFGIFCVVLLVWQLRRLMKKRKPKTGTV